jgi:hypothetical protein
MFDRSLTFENNVVSIEGNVMQREGDYFAFEHQTGSFLSIPDIRFEISTGEPYITKVIGNMGFVSFQADFEANVKGKMVAKGSNMYNFVLTWKNGKWFGVQMTSFAFREEMSIGECPCSITSSISNVYDVLSVIPAGAVLSKKQSQFVFSTGPDSKVIKTQGRTFMWYNSGRIVELSENGTSVNDLGTVQGSDQDAIKQILKNGIFKGVCLNMTEIKL